MKIIMSFRPVCAVTLNAVFFLYKRKIIQSNLIQLYYYYQQLHLAGGEVHNLTLSELQGTFGYLIP